MGRAKKALEQMKRDVGDLANLQSVRAELPGRSGGLRQTLPWLLGLALLAASGFWWWQSQVASVATGRGQVADAGGRRSGGAGAVQPVAVEAAARRDVHVTVQAIGSIAASNTAVVRAQVSGVLQSLNFKEGQQVRAGQWLAQIDARAFQAALLQVEGALARDQAQLENARVDLERYRGLLAKDAIAKQQLDTQAALVHQLEGTVELDRGAVASARLQLSYTRVTAPIAGRTGLKQADLGNTVQPGDANGIVSITQTQPVALVFSVPAANVPRLTERLRADAAIPVEAWDRGGKQRLAVGRVATVDNAIDPSTDTIKVKAMFANTDGALFPNQAVSVVLQLDTLPGALAVPRAAVLRGAQGFYVYVVNDDQSVSARVVKPGAVDGKWMAVEGELRAGEPIVIDGTDRLRNGAKVEVIAAAPRARSPAGARAALSR
ncbi:MAG: efflux RND transporter periplasmic adaptor subunit [Burkholderiales bacterium]